MGGGTRYKRGGGVYRGRGGVMGKRGGRGHSPGSPGSAMRAAATVGSWGVGGGHTKGVRRGPQASVRPSSFNGGCRPQWGGGVGLNWWEGARPGIKGGFWGSLGVSLPLPALGSGGFRWFLPAPPPSPTRGSGPPPHTSPPAAAAASIASGAERSARCDVTTPRRRGAWSEGGGKGGGLG